MFLFGYVYFSDLHTNTLNSLSPLSLSSFYLSLSHLGRAAALFLKRLPFVSDVTVLTGAPRPNPPHPPHIEALHTGLWSPALRCLSQLGLYRPEDYCPVLESCYKTVGGDIIAAPRVGLTAFNHAAEAHSTTDRPSLSFVRNSLLLDALSLQPSAQASGAAIQLLQEDYADVNFSSGEKEAQRQPCMNVVSSTGRHLASDLLVIADGAQSTARLSLLRKYARKDHQEQDLIGDRGYYVIRGHSATRISDISFQTWGPGARFACVPTCQGNAWFAALSAKSASSTRLPLVDAESPPLVNGSRAVTEAELDLLYKRFRTDWHEPINALLASTPADQISICQVANSQYYKNNKHNYNQAIFCLALRLV